MVSYNKQAMSPHAKKHKTSNGLAGTNMAPWLSISMSNGCIQPSLILSFRKYLEEMIASWRMPNRYAKGAYIDRPSSLHTDVNAVVETGFPFTLNANQPTNPHSFPRNWGELAIHALAKGFTPGRPAWGRDNWRMSATWEYQWR
jgi:hypothetical protein